MRKLAAFVCAVCTVAHTSAQRTYESDSFVLSQGTLKITFIGHATLMLEYAGTVIHIDPVSSEAAYERLPKADLILVTHGHSDHFDASAIRALSKPETVVILDPTSAKQLGSGTAMANGDRRVAAGIEIQAVAAYNTSSGRAGYHPKDRDNGYILTLDGKRIYIAGDTEDTPEMRALKDVWVAFLPMNQPYTMTAAQVASAARAFRPSILYPYHYGTTDTAALVLALKDESGIEVRVRRLP